MSGIEVAGIILGAIPLLISGLEHYAEGCSTIKVALFNYESEFRQLCRYLAVERLKFLDTTEKLLKDCVDNDTITNMLDDPGGDEWCSPYVDRQLRERLGRSHEVYIATVRSMNQAVKDFVKRLNLSDEGKPPFADPRSDPKSFREAKKRFKFAVRKSAYMDLVDRIKRDNDALLSLTGHSLTLETARTSHKRRPDFKTIRSNAISVYALLQKVIGGSCHATHRACLQMSLGSGSSQRSVLPLDQSPAQYIIIQHAPIISDQLSTLLEAEIRLLDSTITQSPKFPSAVAITKGRGKKSLRFQEPSTPMLQHTPLEVPLDPQQPDEHLTEISDLCAGAHSLCSTRKGGLCFGYITEATIARRHGLFWPENPILSDSTQDSIRLGSLLTSNRGGKCKLSSADSRRLSVSLALSVLWLCDTPWLAKHWGSDDINLFANSGKLLTQYPFVSTDLPNHVPTQPQQSRRYFTSSSFIRNEALFALGVILIELSLRQSFHALTAPEDLSADGSKHGASDFLTATRLVDRVYEESGERYGLVVRRCINCDFDQKHATMDDESFRGAVYDNIVAVLEEDKRQFFSL